LGALLGAIGGAVLGEAATTRSYKKCVPQGWVDCLFAETAGEAQTKGAVGGGVLGGILGTLIGSAVRWERWTEVRRGRAAMSARSLPGGVGLGVRIRF